MNHAKSPKPPQYLTQRIEDLAELTGLHDVVVEKEIAERWRHRESPAPIPGALDAPGYGKSNILGRNFALRIGLPDGHNAAGAVEMFKPLNP